MKIESAGICRASKRVYEKLIISDAAPGLTVAPYLGQEEGISPLPCKLFRLKGSEYVSVYPDLPIEKAQYAIGAFDKDGILADSAIHTIDFKKAKWESRKNYRLNPEPCKEIRLYDESHDEAHAWGDIRLVQLFGRPNHIQCRINITLHNTAADDLQVLVLNNKLETIVDSYILLGEADVEFAQYSASKAKTISASLCIPWDTQDAFIIARSRKQPALFAQLAIAEETWGKGVEKTEKAIENSMVIAADYDRWFREHRLTPYQASEQALCTFELMPLFSIIVPLYKTPIDLFDDMLGSVLAQTYQNWECILVNSTPEDEALSARVKEAEANDHRIRVVTLQENLGISLNTNKGIAAAKGDFICFFDHDDVTEPDLLFEYVKEINEFPNTDLLYCDEDKLSADGVYCDPVFKIDFSLDLLRNNNYICHMLCIRKSLLDQLQPNTKDLDGAQDHSLTLQAAEKARRIGHATRILYHWRKAPGSTAASGDAKPYAAAAGVLGVQKHLDRAGLKGTVTSYANQTIYKVDYDVPKNDPLVSILIHCDEGSANLNRCIDSILENSTYRNYEIIVIKTSRACSDSSSLEGKAVLPSQVVGVYQQEGSCNFPDAINQGRKLAKGDFLLLLSSNARIATNDWIERMLGNCARPEVGAVGVKACYPDGIIYDAGIALGETPWHSFQGIPKEHWAPYYAKLQRNTSAISAICCMVRTELFDAVQGFTVDFPHAFSDIDFCLKLQGSNKLIVYLPDVEIIYSKADPSSFIAKNKEREQHNRELTLLKHRWINVFAKEDPYYSKGLPKNNGKSKAVAP